MQKKNKIMSLLLTLCMLISAAMPLAANAAGITFSDVPSDHIYYKAITNLAAEGILNGFEDGTFKPEDPVTRAQFTKIICYALGVGELTYGAGTVAQFPDVAADHWAINNITTAKNSGIINGYDDGTFKPENSVLYEQAVKMAVCALGYPEERALRSGGYPNGYIKIASDIKMLKDLVNVKTGEPLTRGGVAQLIDNMRDADIYSEVSNPSRPGSSQTGGGTLRDNNAVQTQQVDGRIVAVYGTSLFHDEISQCNRKQIELDIGGRRVFFGIENLSITDTSKYLGRSVTVYYEHDSSANYDEATNIVFQSRRNKEVDISLDDVEGLVGQKLEYYVDDEETKIDVDLNNMCIILNGAATGDSFATVLQDASTMSGSITLVCSTSEDIADVAFVKTYETMYVGSKDNTNYKIYDYNSKAPSGPFTLDETDSSKTITFTKDGKPATFANIATNNVVSVSQSDDGSLIDVQISTATKKGTITDIISNNKISLDSGATVYRISDYCANNSDETLTPGSYVTLYLDAFGMVARYVLSSEKTYTYGYLSAIEEGSMMSPKVEVMVYKPSTSSAKAIGTKYSLKDNVRIDGEVYSVSQNSGKIMAALAASASNTDSNVAIDGVTPSVGADAAVYSQPIRFTTSSTNVIDSILTSKSTGDTNVSMNIEDHMSTPINCLADKTTLGEYTISSVPVLVIPSDRSSDEYLTRNSSYFKKGTSYYVQLANVSTSKKPAAIYVYVSTAEARETLTEEHIPMIVTDVSRVSYANDTRICLKLMGTDGVTTEVYDDGREGTEIISSLERGDIIRVAADDTKLVDAIELVASAMAVANGTQEGFIKYDGVSVPKDDQGNLIEEEGKYYMEAPYRVVLGEVDYASGNTVIVEPTFDEAVDATTENYTYTENVKLFLIDTQTTNTQKVVTADCAFGEIVGRQQQPDNASKIMIFTSEDDVKAMIIIK